MQTTQGLTGGTIADVKVALDKLIAAGVPSDAIVSAKRSRGGPMTALIATWEPVAASDEPAEASDEPQSPPTA